MTVRRIDPTTGGIVTSGVQFITGIEEIAQTIRTRLRLFFGEYFRDISQGTPWFQVVFLKETSLSRKDAVIKRIISQTPGVVQLINFRANYNIDARTYSISCQVITTFGATELNIDETIGVAG